MNKTLTVMEFFNNSQLLKKKKKKTNWKKKKKILAMQGMNPNTDDCENLEQFTFKGRQTGKKK